MENEMNDIKNKDMDRFSVDRNKDMDRFSAERCITMLHQIAINHAWGVRFHRDSINHFLCYLGDCRGQRQETFRQNLDIFGQGPGVASDAQEVPPRLRRPASLRRGRTVAPGLDTRRGVCGRTRRGGAAVLQH